ncbi:MAG: SCP-2 sterol transfer family protein [Clostridia bacterium]|nr:SCP-2 sterol transfer family protein [Clostridia bacterium]
MTFIEKFEQVKKKFGKVDTSRVTENFAVQVNLTDEDCGGAFFVAYIDGDVAIEPYDYYDNTAMVNIKAKDLIDAIGGKLDVVGAIMGGTIEVLGNVEHFTQMLSLKKPAAKRTAKKADEEKPAKAPAKKTCKKTTAKKETK